MNYDLRRIMTRAWRIYYKADALGFAEALHRARYARFHGLRFFSLFARTSFSAHFATLPQLRAHTRARARALSCS